MKIVLLLLCTSSLGCASAMHAAADASAQSGCPSDRIKTVEEGWTSVVLDVCGKQQLWLLGMDGDYEYSGDTPNTARQQPAGY